MGIILIIVMLVNQMQIDAGKNVDLQILTPLEHISTDLDHIHLVGKTNAVKVEISLNFDKIDDIIVKDSIFHACITFGYGLNKITITPIVGEMERVIESAVSVDVLYGPEAPKKYANIYDDYIFHNSNPRIECQPCHQYDSIASDIIETDQPCFDCHRDLYDNFKTHIPDDERACVNCHHLRYDLTVKSISSFDDRNPCYICHKDKIGRFAQDYVHGPVAGGSCTICHDPHGSLFENSLVEPVEILCNSCHGVIDREDRHRIKHEPFKNGKCGECHDPHATNYKWILIKNSQEICMPCHFENNTMAYHNHPYNVKPKKKLAKPLQLTEAGHLECLSCHNPHATNTEHLLRTSQKHSCLGCHPDM